MQVHNIAVYVLCGVIILLMAYCLFKVFNLSRKVNSVSDFINGEIFSSKFHDILSDYLSNQTNTKLLLAPIMPWIREVVFNECHPQKKETHITDLGGPVFID